METLSLRSSPTQETYGTTLKLPEHELEPPSSASARSKLFFSFVNPLVNLANVRQLHQSDLWPLYTEIEADAAFQSFNEAYTARHGSLVRTLVDTYGWDFFVCGLGSFVMAACTIFAPVVLQHVVQSLDAQTIDWHDLSVWLAVLFASRIVNTLIGAHVNCHLKLTLMRMTASIKSLVFAKAMRHSVHQHSSCDTDGDENESNKSAVEISNLYTSDMDTFMYAGEQLNAVWIFPIQIAVAVYLLYQVLGLAALAGVGVIVISMVLNAVVALSFIREYESIAGIKDGRIKAVKEAFGSIMIVKLNAWETQCLQKIQALRDKEMGALGRYTYMVQLAMFLFFVSPVAVSMASFAVYTMVLHQTLTAAKVFTSMMLFAATRGPLANLPEAVQIVLQARISLARVDSFISSHEVDRSKYATDMSKNDTVAEFDCATFSWNPQESVEAKSLLQLTSASSENGMWRLENVTLQIRKGDFAVMHGAVGSGKSSMCLALLGELPAQAGSVSVRNGLRIAYYSQQPWIQKLTIRDNILFGEPFDAAKYERVVQVCGLEPDLKQFPAGDATEIGQKGINLSGGQKARLSLARACYVDADLVILDSPLAAVDAIVQKHIIRNCLLGLLRHKTVLLVTHNESLIHSKAVTYKIHIADGQVTTSRTDNTRPVNNLEYALEPIDTLDASPRTSDDHKKAHTLVEPETRSLGKVSNSVMLEYLKALGGIPLAILMVIMLLATQCFQVSCDLWLSYWTSDSSNEHTIAHSYLQIYLLLALSTTVLLLLRSLVIAFAGLKASRNLFDAMTRSLLRAPLRFFDANPIGRILNRYSEDMTEIDVEVPFNCGCVLVSIVTTLSQLGVTVYVIRSMGLVLIPLALVYVYVGRVYVAPSRDITRLFKVAASPVLSHVSQSQEGVVVLRAFGPTSVSRAIAENAHRIDASNRAWYAETMVNQWFALRIQLIGCGVVMLVVSTIVLLSTVLSTGLVGLAFMYAVNNDEELIYLVRVWTRFELSMVSPERVLEYVAIPPEGRDKLTTTTKSGTSSWPEHGSIAFESVVFNYKPGDAPVLNGVSFSIHAHEKIGIVGRTGAGKSSLTMALFRINELVSGRIIIDGTDIAQVPLKTLRSGLSLIPQDPVLFQGSLRSFMDPVDSHTDDELWHALDHVGLKALVSGLPGKLDQQVAENGSNFSVGERQMLCLTRALLRKARIVVLDEATASVDQATEWRLQHMIAQQFAGTTVLTIAHRLTTVLNSDRILVVRNGQVVEFDSPRALAAKPNGGVFYQLAQESGCLHLLT